MARHHKHSDFIKQLMKVFLVFPGLFMGSLLIGEAASPHRMQPRVPEGQLEKARALVNPLPESPNVVAEGKILYEGKGMCMNCHGALGNGRGPGAKMLNPPPRNFQGTDFWRHRTEGEIFWVIKHGSTGTAMIPFGGLLADKEIWTIIRYEETFSHHSLGPREMGHAREWGNDRITTDHTIIEEGRNHVVKNDQKF